MRYTRSLKDRSKALFMAVIMLFSTITPCISDLGMINKVYAATTKAPNDSTVWWGETGNIMYDYSALGYDIAFHYNPDVTFEEIDAYSAGTTEIYYNSAIMTSETQHSASTANTWWSGFLGTGAGNGLFNGEPFNMHCIAPGYKVTPNGNGNVTMKVLAKEYSDDGNTVTLKVKFSASASDFGVSQSEYQDMAAYGWIQKTKNISDNPSLDSNKTRSSFSLLKSSSNTNLRAHGINICYSFLCVECICICR